MFNERKKQETTDEESVRRDEGIFSEFPALTQALTTSDGHFSVVFNQFYELAPPGARLTCRVNWHTWR
jgi:hypothetical protein